MVFLTMIGDFLLSEWLWGITFGWSYLPFNIVVMILFLRRSLRMSLVRSTILAVTANGFSLLVYSGIVVGLFMHLLQWWYVPQQFEMEIGPFRANLFLGFIHFTLHLWFFMLVHKLYRVNMRKLFTVALMSNAIAVVLSYFYILFVTGNNF